MNTVTFTGARWDDGGGAIATIIMTATGEIQHCGNCRFRNLLRCHRNPPQRAGIFVRAEWPAVRIEDWCGEWITRYPQKINGEEPAP